MKNLNLRHLQKIDRNISELNEIKKLRGKHFRKKDRNYLFDKINSFEKRIVRVLKSDLKIAESNVAKLEDSRKEIEKVSKIVKGLLLEMNKKLRTLEHQKELIEWEESKLSEKKNLLIEKRRKINEVLKERKKKITLVRNQKKKVQ